MAPSAIVSTTEYTLTEFSDQSLKVNHNNHGKDHGRALTKAHLKRRIQTIDTDTCDAGEEDAFFVADMGEVYRQHLRWKMNLKRVKPHYGTFFLSHVRNKS